MKEETKNLIFSLLNKYIDTLNDSPKNKEEQQKAKDALDDFVSFCKFFKEQ